MKLLLEFVEGEPCLQIDLTEKDFQKLQDVFYVSDECYLEDKKINLGIFISEDDDNAIKKRQI